MTNTFYVVVNFTQTAEFLVDTDYIPDAISGIASVFYITTSSPVNIFVSVQEKEKVRRFGHVIWDHRVIKTFRAVPVSGWGRRYHAVTFGYRYSLILVSDDNINNVTVTFNAKDNSAFSYTRNGIVYRSGQSIKLELRRLKAYVITSCDNTICTGSLTGSSVISDGPIGVITGNCRSSNDNMKCTISESSGENYIIEMLMPQESYGKEFILFKKLGRIKGGYGVIVAGSNNTIVNRYSIRETSSRHSLEVKTIKLNDAKDWTMQHSSDLSKFMLGDDNILARFE
ncbi:hypothetical protein Btru_030982 [Bulinus truncatus]|nr:hypothetical protein Btru_030982 [Bulinus truncatus]